MESTHSSTPRCWCGNTDLEVYSADYLRCPRCHTLVVAHPPAADIAHVAADEQAVYGRDYWFAHQQQELGQPDITVRARTDLAERCVHWATTLLKYRLPPARVLELGSGHGGFVAMLRWLGFDATGLELSPWVVDFARRTFDAPFLLGPIEDQAIPEASLDAVILMDVLEHLPDPVGTLRRCLSLLAPGGLLLIQTPCFPLDQTYASLLATGHRFTEMLQPQEHLFLFSQASVQQLFRQLGAPHVVFEPAYFSAYDMFLVVSREPLEPQPPDRITQVLEATPSARLVRAVLDAGAEATELRHKLAEADADRAARLEAVEHLTDRLAEAEADRAARLEALERASALLAESEADRAARLETIQRLSALLSESEADRAARLEVIERQHELLAQGETHRATLLRTVQQQAMQLRYLQESAAEAQARRGLRALRLLRRGARAPSHATRAVGLRRVLVDLVPLLPGGENGGAKVATLALLRCLARRTLDQVDWVLLTSERAHDELRGLQAPNVRLVSVQSEAPASPKRWPHPVRRLVNTFDTRVRRPARPRSFDADLLFCPFTAPLHFDPTVPTVCVVYDLQYLEYPEFFTAEERQVRDRTFRDACQLATRLVCISDFVRNSVLQRGGVPPESVVTIHLCNTRTSAIVSDECASPTLRELGVRAGRYLLYPANPWPHKNHRMLLTAFGMYRAWNPRSDLKLVCTGAAVEGDRDIRADAERMGLGDHVVVAGYLSDQQLEAVMERAKALVFPSLYEGFGMPVLEAMDCGVPVLCSNLTSLPEVAGDAALLFDPRKPSEIADAIARIETEPELVADLIARGATQAARFGRIEDVASRYLALFESTVGEARQFPDALHGVHPDGWAGQRVLVTYGPSMQARELELVLLSPEWSPLGQLQLSMRLSNDGQRGAGSRPMQRGKPVTLRQAIPRESGFIELTFDRAFQPARLGMNEDTRELTCLVQGCTLRSATEMIDLLRG